jgi:hypothetical protein
MEVKVLKVAIQIVAEDLDDVEDALQDVLERVQKNRDVPFSKHLIADDGSEAAIGIRELEPDEARPRWSIYHQTPPIN